MKTINNPVPSLRFPEFTDEWEIKRLGEIGIFYRGHSYNVDDVNNAGLLVLRSNNINNNLINYKGLQFVTKPCSNDLLLQDKDILICMSNGSKKLVGKSATYFFTDKYEQITVGAFCSIFRSSLDIARYLFQTDNYKRQIDFVLEGANINNLKNSILEQFEFLMPQCIQEQQKIADCLSSLDELITLEEEKLITLTKYKKGLMQKIFPQGESLIPELRFPEFTDKWERKKIKDVLSYEQPTNYIVNDNYLHKKGIPVLTANKSFILGYSNNKNNIYEKVPVIIFDDFTTDKKFVNFPFKVKSSAIKILKPIRGNNLKFIFNLLQLKNFSADEHKRYYIQIYRFLDITVPSIPEQQKIADFLSSLDELIENQELKIEQLKQHKKGLLQGLFPNMNGVENA